MNKTETNIQRWSRCRGYKSKLEKRNFHAQRYRKRRGSFYAFQNLIKWNAWLPTVICLLSWQRLYSLLAKHAFSCPTVVNVTSSNSPVRGLHGEFKGSRLAHQLHTDWQNESSKISVQAVKSPLFPPHMKIKTCETIINVALPTKTVLLFSVEEASPLEKNEELSVTVASLVLLLQNLQSCEWRQDCSKTVSHW